MSNAPENYNTSKYICNNIISNNVYLNCDSLPNEKTEFNLCNLEQKIRYNP